MIKARKHTSQKEKNQTFIEGVNFNKKSKLLPISKLRQNNSFTSGIKQQEQQIKKMSLNEFLEKCVFLINYYHKQSKLDYHAAAIKFLAIDWQKYRVKLNERLNKITYMEPTIKYKSYTEIEQEIIKQWKKNPIFSELQKFWFNATLGYEFGNPEQFEIQFKNQVNFIAQLAFIVFKPFLNILQQKGFDTLQRLTDQTAPFILTQYTQWAKIYRIVIQQLYKQPQQLNMDFDLNTLQINSHILDNKQSISFPNTITLMQVFTIQTKLRQKIRLLREIRSALETEITLHQEKLMKVGQMKKYEVIQKDDFIGCIIYCLINGQIKNMTLALRYFSLLLGEKYTLILSRSGVDSYRADLQGAVQYLQQHCLQSKLIKLN